MKKSIENELFWSPFVDAEHITVSVKGGVATLYGMVVSRDDMRAAVHNAYEGGARRVINRVALNEDDPEWRSTVDQLGLMETDRYETP